MAIALCAVGRAACADIRAHGSGMPAHHNGRDAEERSQLDLFLESSAVTLVNAVVNALSAHDATAAATAVEDLRSHAPQRFAATLTELHDELLARDWQRFLAACEWRAIEDADLPAWFPAWYLIEHPAAIHELDYFIAPISPPTEAARLLEHLYGLERRGDWRALAAAREKLRALDADLFATGIRATEPAWA